MTEDMAVDDNNTQMDNTQQQQQQQQQVLIESSSVSMSKGREIALQLIHHAASRQDDVSEMTKIISVAEQQQQQQQQVSDGGRPWEWLDILVQDYLLQKSSQATEATETATTTLTTNEAAFWVIAALVQKDVELYLGPIAKSVLRAIENKQRQPQPTPLYLSDNVLQVWISQMILSPHVAVHSDLLQALLGLFQLPGSIEMENTTSGEEEKMSLLSKIMVPISDLWKVKLHDDGDSQAASIVAVRCASSWLDLLGNVGDEAWDVSSSSSLSCSQYLKQMMQNVADPLVQLSILDLIPQHLGRNLTQKEKHLKIKKWLTNPEMVQPILELLSDPLLEGAAMQYLSWLCTLYNNNNNNNNNNDTADTDEEDQKQRLQVLKERLFSHIRDLGVVTSSESERLAIVHALVHLCSAQESLAQDLLQDATLRHAWWDMTRLSSPKLQAAILSSISQVLNNPRLSVSIRLQIYNFLAQDNNASSSTTSWLLQKYTKSPMPELRIASYAVYAAVASLVPLGPTILVTTSHGDFTLWLREGQRETTVDARMAKYDVLHTFHRNLPPMISSQKDVTKQLDKLLALGPHGMEAQSWDISTME